ncbi:DUF4864 domain-containing protein [Caenimonas aquaedulcis]|uniref:DUF4864 domain-containing protein n=1 Tax=Caenimonas aquaedulcis TaxID=2793270 RepID=A0A931H3D9_9BURK|nr:DUF4864 domain-containing protein [Caenimonas aquaedulcis]MBG9387792.1 DUF4864 domain-containing protein [Caenimonas aquaedulcis]
MAASWEKQMNPMFVRFFMVAAMAIAATSALKAHAETLAENDAQQVQRIVVAQFEAFAQDDADRAFETATPAVQAAIGNSGHFLALVRGAYPMVYRPVAIHLQKPELSDGSVLQLVEIRDDHDKSWLALFALERQPDNSWRIGGCVVSENRWRDA